MDREERHLIDQYFAELVQDIIPVDMLPYLGCLTQPDREMIRSEETNKGPIRAAIELLSRIQRRTAGFRELVYALQLTGCAHLAALLVPREEEGENVDDLQNVREVQVFPLLDDQIKLSFTQITNTEQLGA